MNRLKNQLHTVSRWPNSRAQRSALARTTLGYVQALNLIYRDQPEQGEVFQALYPLYMAAVDKLSVAQELGGES